MRGARGSVDHPVEHAGTVSFPPAMGIRARTVARAAAVLTWAAVGLVPAQVMDRREGARTEPDRPLARARFLMGTRLSIEAVGPVSEEAFEAAFREVARLEGILSNWKPESELSLLNDRASKDWVRCSPDLYRAVRENQASEQSARMIAMRNSTDNANELIEDLTLVYNKTRQATITREMIEIASGAEALGG